MTTKNDIKNMSWREFEKVAEQYPYKLPKIFSMIDDDVLLTPKDVSELIGISTETVRNWCRKGKIRIVSPIGRFLISGEDLREFMFNRFKENLFKEN